MPFWAYILRCSDGSYYAGHTDDLEARVAAHQSGLIAGYTQRRRPIALVWSQDFQDREQAFAVERQLKGWSRAKKEALIGGDFDLLRQLARKPALRYAGSAGSPATQHERGEEAPDTLILSRGLSEVEGPVSKDPAIVLVRPQLGANIGKAARAMLNFGLTDLRLVAPRDGWPNPDAGPAASGADLVLAQARLFDSVSEAIADCSEVYASTVRRRELVMPVVTPEQMAAAIHRSAGRSAILFGPERSGLETEEVALASAIVTVPVNPDFGSLNLAQAVILLAYDWSKQGSLAMPTLKEAEPAASQAELDALLAHLDGELDKAGYFHPPERSQATRNSLRTLLTKPRWSSREIRAVRGIVRALTGGKRRSGE